MEALNDVGAAEFLGVRTLTVSIYTTWLNQSSLAGAAQIALFMLVLVLTPVEVERWARRRQRHAAPRAGALLRPRPLRGARGWAVAGVVSLPVLCGFVLPAGYLVVEAVARLRFAGIERHILTETLNTVGFAAVTTVVATLIAFLLVSTLRQAGAAGAHGGSAGLARAPGTTVLVRLATVGYAVPGTVMGLGLLGPLGWFDAALDGFARGLFGVSTGLVLSASGAALVYAYVARFLAVGSGAIEAGFARIAPRLDEAARSLGAPASRLAWRVHAPLALPAVAAAMLLVFVDCMKELPATLLLRPLNFETLATHLYGEAARGTYESGAIAALLIVLTGLLPVVLLARVGDRVGGDGRAAGGAFGTEGNA